MAKGDLTQSQVEFYLILLVHGVSFNGIVIKIDG